MRKLILDTETTGLDPEKDRIIELACIELIDDIPSGVKFHQYYNSDGIIISHEAELIHGINNKYLRKFRSFDEKIDEFLEFVSNKQMIINKQMIPVIIFFDLFLYFVQLRILNYKIKEYNSFFR